MAEHISPDTSFILKQGQLSSAKLERAMEQLSSGKKLLRPGDNTAAYAEVQALDFERSADEAKGLAAQTRLSWYQTSSLFLTQTVDVLSSMSELIVKARSNITGAQDIAVLDETFQGYKAHIAQIVDGQSGKAAPSATFHDKPLYVGFSPAVEIGTHVTTPLNGAQDVNLYTGFGVDGFAEIPLVDTGATGPMAITLKGTADGGNFDDIVLDRSASSQDNVYNGMTITITGGAGVGESAVVANYDGSTRTATFVNATATQLNGSSEYTLTAGHKNNGLTTAEGFTSVRFAEEVWGSDNDRLERLTPGAGTFRAQTPEETAYRIANSIPDTDMEAKTYEEKEARRKLNIFDSEYGNLRTEENANRMHTQVQNAITQITVFLQRHESRSATLVSQLEAFSGRSLAASEGAQKLGGADPFETAAKIKKLALEPEKLLNLAAKLQENLAKLSTLVQNKGVR